MPPAVRRRRGATSADFFRQVPPAEAVIDTAHGARRSLCDGQRQAGLKERPMSPRFDLVIRNGTIVDGTGSAAREGDEATIVSGKVTYRDGEATGTLPGRIVRGQREAVRQAAE
jgi:hypothetical protein